ncbi:MAG: DUF368 domain-containing protein [Bacillota bacterium]
MNVKRFLQGFPLGLANTLPGISGGTVALILYVYEPLLKALKKINLKFLIPFGLGAAAGAFFGATVIERLFNLYTAAVYAFLAGMILASTKVTLKEAGGFRKNTKILLDLLAVFLGIFMAYYLTHELASAPSTATYQQIFIGGVVGSITMILPGISGGTVLVMMGVYRPVIAAISRFDLLPLLFFGAGLAVGLIIFAWILVWLLKHFRRALMLFLTGLILGSFQSALPSQFGRAQVIFFILGLVTVVLFTEFTSRQKGR